MKKLFLLGIILILISGCTSISNKELKVITNEVLESKIKTTNINRHGYNYYLPKGMSIVNSNNFSEVLTLDEHLMYLYVDVVSYHKKTGFSYNINNNAYYSNILQFNGKKGYIEINNYKNDKFLIEIMYNYAKIEVVGYSDELKKLVTYAITIINSITYNDSVIENYLSNSSFNSVDEAFNIFEIVGSDNFLQFEEDKRDTETKVDPDYIK